MGTQFVGQRRTRRSFPAQWHLQLATHLVGQHRVRKSLTARWRLQWNSDNGAAILLALTALATAWSGYQASVWGGIQAASYTHSAVLRGKASQANDEIARSRLVDVALFTRWLEADAAHEQKLRAVYESHFRPEFRVAFERWRKNAAAQGGTSTPFDPPGYASSGTKEARGYETEAARALETGDRANNLSDEYVYITVILATVMFFAGAVRPVIAPAFRTPVLAVATLLCIWALGQLITAPIAR